MSVERQFRSAWFRGLSARLLALTVLFVMLAEVLIYVPSISRFRKAYLEDQIEKAYLAILAVRDNPEQAANKSLTMDLLFHAGAYAIVLKTPERRMLMLSKEMPPTIDVTFDLRRHTFVQWIGEAFAALVQTGNRVMRVLGTSPGDPQATIEVLLDETPMREAMYGFSVRILSLSIVISLIAAGLVYLSLQWLMVRPIGQITECMMRFRENPEDETATLLPSCRSDEIGIAQRELAAMQDDLRAALRQKTHLAALGTAVAKINHDLRNALATAVLASDRLSTVDDPEVQRALPRLYAAIDRAVALCSQTLNYVQDVRRTLRLGAFRLTDLVREVEGELSGSERHPGGFRIVAGEGCQMLINADRRQLFRVFMNLALNARQAGANTSRIDAHRAADGVAIEVADDGPGIPEPVRAKLFLPFAGSSRDGGTGLGLVIAREIVAAHGGELTLVRSGPEGTIFRIGLPDRSVAS